MQMAFYLAGEIVKLKSQYPGSVVPLAMFIILLVPDIYFMSLILIRYMYGMSLIVLFIILLVPDIELLRNVNVAIVIRVKHGEEIL